MRSLPGSKVNGIGSTFCMDVNLVEILTVPWAISTKYFSSSLDFRYHITCDVYVNFMCFSLKGHSDDYIFHTTRQICVFYKKVLGLQSHGGDH